MYYTLNKINKKDQKVRLLLQSYFCWIRHIVGTSAIVVQFLTGYCLWISAINFRLYFVHSRFIKYNSNIRCRDGSAQSKYIFILQEFQNEYDVKSWTGKRTHFCHILPKFCSLWKSQYLGISKHCTSVLAKIIRSSICSPNPKTHPTLYWPTSTKRIAKFPLPIGSLFVDLRFDFRKPAVNGR